jgi:myosin-7
LKPNNEKAGRSYDDELIITQLRYSGMLDIVRIRREGYPIHVPAREFLNKYQCLAAKDPEPLPADEKMAAAKILRSLNLPQTEWQIGKTKIFLRISVFDPLEERRKALITEKMIVIQKVWRGFVARRRYRRLRVATVVLQKHFRGSRQRVRFVRKRKAAVTIQAYYRGMLARELAAALRKKRAEEEAERRRLKKLEEEKQAKERAQKSMEESFRAAQVELLTLAKMAEHKSQKAVTKSGDVDLDQMFNFLAQDSKPTGKREKDFLADVTSDLELMFQKGQVASEPKKPARKAPKPPSSKGVAGKHPKSPTAPASQPSDAASPTTLTRTQRRQRRVIKKLLGVEGEANRRDEAFDPTSYPMIKFAEMYFNDFPQDTSGFSTLSLRRAPKVTDPLPKESMLTFTKSTNLPTSMVHMHDPENVNLACGIFKDICRLLKGDMKESQYNLTIQSTIAYGIERSELRDEIFCQLIRQVSSNPKEDAVMRGWHFITLCVIGFPPSKNFNKV